MSMKCFTGLLSTSSEGAEPRLLSGEPESREASSTGTKDSIVTGWEVGVLVGVSVIVAVGVLVADGPGRGVLLGVAVYVGVEVAWLVGKAVFVGVRVGVAVPPWMGVEVAEVPAPR